ncbi:hypothetical protein [Streptomyces sp. ITFR-16]|uniref:hypothetical protein n=1 Tax=Streptomyces sp. ITFR-16 TaxID=3075198 RepID=UPI00288C1E9E|nr:hypothetical protein [Streptomyces sp. ITFR-16]WNI24060.1 hypothetical protein RLT58_20030 [Streptomyces sp. ITFR-16]
MARGSSTGLKACTGTAAALLLLVAGCGSPGGDEPDAPKATAGRGSRGSEDIGRQEKAADGRDALAAYRGMWDVQVEAYSSGSMPQEKPAAYTTGDATVQITDALTYYNQQGLAFEGRPVTDPEVSGVDTSSAVHSATITDCVDVTGIVVRRATGKPLPATKDDRRPWTAKAMAGSGGAGWRISDYTIDKNHTR